MKKTTMSKSRNRTNTASLTKTLADLKLANGSVAAVTAVSGAIGLWAVACFVSGVIVSGGPLDLAKAWISAIIGM